MTLPRRQWIHRPTEQILLGNQVHLYQGNFIVQLSKFCLVIVLYQGGPGPRPRSGPSLVQNNNQAKFDPKNNQAKFARLDGEILMIRTQEQSFEFLYFILLSIPLGLSPPPSRENILREELCLGLVQNESKAHRLISISN